MNVYRDNSVLSVTNTRRIGQKNLVFIKRSPLDPPLDLETNPLERDIGFVCYFFTWLPRMK